MFLLLLAAPVLVMVLAIPLILGLVKRNPWYGIRTPRAMTGTEADWYTLNRKGGFGLLFGGAASLLLMLLFRLHGPIHGNEFAILATSLPVFLLIGLSIALKRR